MGRKKIKIARINDDRNRSVTYLKRKAGLMKKAHELAILTGSEVAVIVFGQNGKLTEFCSSDMDRVLLRYTEHTGPVERKGPEHYSNEEDDGSDEDGDGEGDDVEADGEDGDGEGGGGGGAAGMDGTSGRQYSPPDQGRNGVKSEKGQDSAKTNKRKAPNGHKRKEGNGNSISSETSSKRGSPPHISAPLIKVDGNDEDYMSTETSDNNVDKGVLKAAIISRSGSKSKSGISHHHSFSTGSESRSGIAKAKSPYNSISSFDEASIPPIPHRPYTADPSLNLQPSISSQFGNHGDGATSSRFAHSVNVANGNFLRPQQWFDGMQHPHLIRASSASAIGHDDLSYGDLARGGINSPMDSSHRANGISHQQSPMSPVQQGHPPYPSIQISVQPQEGQSQIIPLAHPILRQHPQYELCANQYRMQQSLGRNNNHTNNSSMAISGIHTAPSSPNHLALGDNHFTSNNINQYTSSTILNTGIDPSTAKRSASFGYVAQQNDRREFQQSLNNDFTFATNPFTNDRHQRQENNIFQQDAGLAFNSEQDRSYTPMSASAHSFSHREMNLPSGGADNDANADQSNESNFSNAAFNDLMGSILSDMGSSSHSSSVSESVNGSHKAPSNEKQQESRKEQDEAMRSMESNGSLATLVNSESFDTLLKKDQSDRTLFVIDSPTAQRQRKELSSPEGQDHQIFPSILNR